MTETLGTLAFAQSVEPIQSFAKCSAAMAVLCFLFGGQLCEGFSNRRKVEHRVVAEPVGALQMIENHALGDPTKSRQRAPVSCCHDYAEESSRALLRWNALQFSQNAGI